jgi:hypothetical protein
MPDAWEKANGLNPNDAADGNKIIDNSQLTIHNSQLTSGDSKAGYTNLERYLNSIVADITTKQNQ